MDSPPPEMARDRRPVPSSTAPATAREDCWTEDATHTLVEAWGEHYLDLNRGNLRQKHWEEVADAVNARHGHIRKQRRTDIQCKNRIDTLKKKYKIEKARVSDSDGVYTSQWPFFDRLDDLIGDNFQAAKKTLQAVTRSRRNPPPPTWLSSPVPVGRRSATLKRHAQTNSPAGAPVTSPTISPVNSYFPNNFSVFAAAAAAAAEEEELEEKELEETWSGSRSSGSGRRDVEGDKEVGFKELAQAIHRFTETYEKVEEAKQRKMFELEKQRMQFTKDLEYQRMQMFMETQVELQKLKRAKKSQAEDDFS